MVYLSTFLFCFGLSSVDCFYFLGLISVLVYCHAFENTHGHTYSQCSHLFIRLPLTGNEQKFVVKATL